ncbi:lactonase family protein [Streptomyces sp. URMC 123]|uniref:lactonase family protein n=1 Tax=Streptomyces sp. URMC 123 TaxID=3423403 RepID=UPI003F1CAEBA
MGSASGIGRRRLLTLLAAGAAGAGATAARPGEARGAGEGAARPGPGPGGGAPDGRAPLRRLFLGAYTSGSGGAPGLGLAGYDPDSGRIVGTGALDGVADPSYLALSPTGRTLYTVNERRRGAVTAIALDAGGWEPRVLGSRPADGGPCHLSVHPEGRHLLSANYRSGSVTVHPVLADGGLGPRSDLVTHTSPAPGPGQSGPHAHQVVTAPDGRHVLAVDLGTDTVYGYRLDPRRGTLTERSRSALRPGAGPRQLAFHPSGRFAYVANELDDTVVVCRYDPAEGVLTPGRPQPTGSSGPVRNYPSHLLTTADGRFLYLANRGHNSVACFAVEAAGARLRLLGTVPVGGDFPRHIAFDPRERWLFAANQRSGTVTVFAVHRGTGGLTPVGRPFETPAPACVLPL